MGDALPAVLPTIIDDRQLDLVRWCGAPRVLDLFSGIGGFSLGLERAGMRTVAFCEIDPYARRVLSKHWPEVPCYDDVRTLDAARLAADGIAVDVICGGFPCQDISLAGKGEGLAGERSGLWREIARQVGELRPRYVIVENVAALLGRGLGSVLGDLAALGYDAEWHCIPASAVGAPHRRDRVWIVAYPQYDRASIGRRVADVGSHGCEQHRISRHEPQGGNQQAQALLDRRSTPSTSRWPDEPKLGRVAYGVPAWLDRMRTLGNAVVPQIPELIGRAIMEAAWQSDARCRQPPGHA